jgi:hypothetical protein
MPAAVAAGLCTVGDAVTADREWASPEDAAAESSALARPKSSTFTVPSGRSLILAVLEEVQRRAKAAR